MPAATELVIAGFLIPAAIVFVISYRHALRHWLRPVEPTPLPTAAIASAPRPWNRAAAVRRFHAVAIAAAFASVSIMALIAVALVGLAVVGTVI